MGYQFKDEALLELALRHRSVGSNNNERVEFLGDSILNFVIAEALFKKFPDCREGTLSQMRAQLVRGKTLAEIAMEFELGDCLVLGPGEMKSGGHRRESILADAVEALIGVIYLDAGLETCQQRVLDWYASRLQDISPEEGNKDSKTLLQEYLQSRKKALPVYHLVTTSGSDHQQQFDVECEIAHLRQRFKGRGSSRKVAEQLAAEAALLAIQAK